jgi:hypothetical protein
MVSANGFSGQEQKIGAKKLRSCHNYSCQRKHRKAQNGKEQIKNGKCQQIKAFFPRGKLQLLQYDQKPSGGTIYTSVSQPVGRGPQVGHGQLSMGLQSNHFAKFYYNLLVFIIIQH